MVAIGRVEVEGCHPCSQPLSFIDNLRQFLFAIIFAFRVVLAPGNMVAIGRVEV